MENEQGNLIILLMCIVLMKNLSFDPKALSFFPPVMDTDISSTRQV